MVDLKLRESNTVTLIEAQHTTQLITNHATYIASLGDF